MRKVKVGTSPAGCGGEGRWRSTLPPSSSAISDRTLSSRAQTSPLDLVRTPRVEAHSLLLFLATFSTAASTFDEIHGCDGFVEASLGLAKSRKASNSKLDYSDITVDILGDEVDTLLSVLGKIYIALDHYSPVLKHYPRVTEILKLVQKALKGESV